MRKHNGDVTYWQVQAQWLDDKKSKNWFLHTYCDIVASKKFSLKDYKEDDVPSACGTCWQKYGIFGVLNEEAGIKWLELVRRENKLQEEGSPERIKIWGRHVHTPVRFRLAKVHLVKKTEVVNI